MGQGCLKNSPLHMEKVRKMGDRRKVGQAEVGSGAPLSSGRGSGKPLVKGVLGRVTRS